MKKWVVALLIIIFLSMLVTARITGYQTAEQTKEIDVPAGWDFISFPSSTTISLAFGNLHPAIYQLKNSKWERFTLQTFQPNTGYFIDFVQGGKIKIPIATSQSSIHLTKGMNVIGVSIDVQIKDGKIKSKGTEKSFSDVITSFWEFDGKQQKWNKIDNYEFTLKPGKGYLLYAKEEGELVFETAKIIGGWSDNFEDGDYTKNPVWKVTNYGNPPNYATIGETTNAHGGTPIGFGRGYLHGRNVLAATKSTTAYGTWEFDVVEVLFDSQQAFIRNPIVYFIVSLTKVKTEGYYFTITREIKNKNKLVAKLDKFVNQQQEISIPLTEIAKHTKSRSVIGDTPPPSFHTSHVKIIRESNGNFLLYVDDGLWKGNDNSITTSDYFMVTGVPHQFDWGKGVAPFSIDNIRVTPLSSQPTTPQPVTSVQPLSQPSSASGQAVRIIKQQQLKLQKQKAIERYRTLQRD